MYGTSLSLSRVRGTYDDYDRLGYPWPKSSWPTQNTVDTNARSGQVSSTKTMANSHSNTPGRRNRYSRASTTSVTQLLSDSCSSLLQKLTTRVRGPSATIERHIHKQALSAVKSPPPPITTNNNNINDSNNSSSAYTSTRHRLEDKYSAVLDRIYGRKRDPERTIEPSVGRGLAKSATTSNVFLTEKAYPYVHINNVREKTPYRNEGKTKHHKQQYPEPPYTYLDRDSAYRIRHKSNHSDLRPRRSAKPMRTGKSESERNNLKLCPVEIPLVEDNRKATENVNSPAPLAIDEDVTPTPSVPDPISEREAKRKEIQSLIMKYSALDEAYNKAGGNAMPGVHQSAASAIAQKYQTRLAPAVSNGRV